MTEASDTGRIKGYLNASIRDKVFGSITCETVEHELSYYAHIDYAHVTMLSHTGIIQVDTAKAILSVVGSLYKENFAQLIGKPSPRGTYLAYESFIMSEIGVAFGGALQTGRSRNDLNATVFKMRLREPYQKLNGKLTLLITRLLQIAAAEDQTLCPAYTHYQPAFVGTIGHYMRGISEQLLRDLAFVHSGFANIDDCPLGACAGGGTSFKINQEMTSEILGFEGACNNSVDAVASRDLCVKGIAAIAQLATSLSRLSADFIFWSGSEVAIAELPDSLVGSSSNMPQKRNPFLLEMIKGRCSSITGSWVGATASIQWTPFSNSVSVSGESTKHVWQAFTDIDFILDLTNAIADGISFRERNALDLMEAGMVDAVFFAEEAVRKSNVSFRQAHHDVGNKVNEAITRGESLRQVLCAGKDMAAKEWFCEVSRAFAFGGGTGDRQSSKREAAYIDDICAEFYARCSRWDRSFESISHELLSVN